MFRTPNSPIFRSTFLTAYTAIVTMHRHCCRPVPRLRWNLRSISTVAPVGISVGALYQKLYIQSKSAPEDGRICRPKHGTSVPSQPWHRSAAVSVHCTKSCIQVKKCSWGWANLSPETCRAELKRLINEKVVASFWLFTSAYLFQALSPNVKTVWINYKLTFDK